MAQFSNEEFPILCETCLGDNPYLRMTRDKKGGACKICERPFDIYRWRPGPKARFKKTEICQTCAKLKNVCQTCILDLEYGLPVQVRDEAIKQQTNSDSSIVLANMPVQRANRDFMYEQIENNTGIARQFGGNLNALLPYDKVSRDNNDGIGNGNQMLLKLKRDEPYYKRNLPHICSFYVKGTCNRGDACPYRHELPIKGELSDQNIKDRFFGHNDPVAKKMLERHNEWKNGGGPDGNIPKPATPDDITIRTLFIGGIDHSITQDHIRDKFSPFGNIGLINCLPNKRCAFVTFNRRNDAENAVNALYDSLYLNNKRCKLHWGKSESGKNDDKDDETKSDNETNTNTNTNTNKTKRKTSSNNDNSNSNDTTTKTKTKTKNKRNDDSDSDDDSDLDAPPGMRKAPIYSESERKYLQSQGILPPELPPMPDPSLSIANQNASVYDHSNKRRYNNNNRGGRGYSSMSSHYNEATLENNNGNRNSNSNSKTKLGGQYAYPTHAMYSNLNRQQHQMQQNLGNLNANNANSK